MLYHQRITKFDGENIRNTLKIRIETNVKENTLVHLKIRN